MNIYFAREPYITNCLSLNYYIYRIKTSKIITIRTDLVITRPLPPHVTILYNLMFAIPLFARLSHKDCKIYALQDHHNHITVTLHSIYFKTAQHTTY